METLKTIKTATDYIKNKIQNRQPVLGLILGSGLGAIVDDMQDAIKIPYDEIPGFPNTTVVGHQGNLVIGKLGGKEVLVIQGRFHFYEGRSLNEVVLPIRVMDGLGIKNLIVTNASGGINPNFKPGDLVLIDDHINYAGRNPLIGENLDELGPRFPDMSEAYSKKINSTVVAAGKDLGIDVKSGVYVWVLGPSYETPAEIKMFSIMGADMVGMSTVPEVIAAKHLGMNVCGISCITNHAAGIVEQVLDHDDVKKVAQMVREKFTGLVTKAIEKF